MSGSLIEIDCDLCRSSRKKFIKNENGYPISRCLDCTLIYVSGIPQIQNGKVIGEYYSGTAEEIALSEFRYRKVSECLVEELGKLSPSKGKLLDVGCGYGHIMLAAQRSGWEVFGTELSEIAVDRARERGLSNVVLSELSDDVFDDVKFDAVNLTNVLEHVPSPSKILENCRDRLEMDGVILVRVPNMNLFKVKERFNPILRSLGMEKYIAMHYMASPPPTHLTGFTTLTLTKFFEKTGFDMIEIKPSKMSAPTGESLILRVVELFIRTLFRLTFGRINLSPTMLAVARKKNGRRAR